jgi:hypothetical protein
MDSPAEQPKPIFVLSEVGNAIKTLQQNYQFSASNRRKLVEATNLLHQVFMEVQKIRDAGRPK